MNAEQEYNKSITELFYMINAAKELNKNSISSQNLINSNKYKDNKDLEKEIQELKNKIISFEEKYGYFSPFHDDIINKLKIKKGKQILTDEISQKIYELYKNKYYIDCYDLWSIYGFQQLINISPDNNYEVLRHLTKIRDELYRRKYILDNLDNFNLFDDDNLYFETGLFFKSIHKDKHLKNGDFYNNKNIKNILNIKNEISKTYNEDTVNQKINENNILLEELKNKVLNYSYN